MAGEGTVEQTSTPSAVAGSSRNASTRAATRGATGVDTAANLELTDADFRKDGNIRAAKAREINENVSGKATERSFNELTNETTVTTTVGGQVVTFVEDGDTRSDEQRSATDGIIEAFDRAVEKDSEGV